MSRAFAHHDAAPCLAVHFNVGRVGIAEEAIVTFKVSSKTDFSHDGEEAGNTSTPADERERARARREKLSTVRGATDRRQPRRKQRAAVTKETPRQTTTNRGSKRQTERETDRMRRQREKKRRDTERDTRSNAKILEELSAVRWDATSVAPDTSSQADTRPNDNAPRSSALKAEGTIVRERKTPSRETACRRNDGEVER